MNEKDPGQMAAKASQGKPEGRLLGMLRAVALTVLIFGATGSLIFMFREGQATLVSCWSFSRSGCSPLSQRSFG